MADDGVTPGPHRVLFQCPFGDWQVDMHWSFYNQNKKDAEFVLKQHLVNECQRLTQADLQGPCSCGGPPGADWDKCNNECGTRA